MKSAWKAAVLTALLAATAQAVGAQASPQLPAVAPTSAGLTLVSGMVIPQTTGSTFSIAMAVSIGLRDTSNQFATRQIKSDVEANVPNSTIGVPVRTSIVAVFADPAVMLFDFSQANFNTLATYRSEAPLKNVTVT
jgi:hypothetical protein